MFLTTHYMEEADRVAQRIGIIDHGEVIAQGTPETLKHRTGSGSLEEAFLVFTGSAIREEAASSADEMRDVAKMWNNGR